MCIEIICVIFPSIICVTSLIKISDVIFFTIRSYFNLHVLSVNKLDQSSLYPVLRIIYIIYYFLRPSSIPVFPKGYGTVKYIVANQCTINVLFVFLNIIIIINNKRSTETSILFIFSLVNI